MTFEEMGLHDNLLRAVKDLGFEQATPIQEKTIPGLLESDKDLIALAQTGTGKTAAFGLPIIEQIEMDTTSTQALILSPTRELCIQITNDLKDYAKYYENLRITPVYGGAKIDGQIRSLKKGSHIVVGTPGRVVDLINRKILKVHDIDFLVLDEADEMLKIGFKEELNTILSQTPKEKQTLLFSATMPEEIRRITKKYMNEPDEISAGKKNTGAENVVHHYYMVNARDRYETLKRIADMNPDVYGIVFCRTKKETQEIADKLLGDGYNADALHGDLSQVQRDLVMHKFRTKHLQMLVATDVAARGIDVDDLTHIINYNLPDEQELYIHRSGRTGRAGKTGISVSIVHSREKRKIKELEKKVGKPFERKMVPNGRQVCEKQLFNLIDRMEHVEVEHEEIDVFLETVYKKLGWLSREELIQRFVSIEFNRFLEYYKDARDLNISFNKSEQQDSYNKKQKNGRQAGKRRDYSKFYINVGSVNGLTAQRLMGIINEVMNSKKAEIGKIEIMKKFSFFEIDSKFSKKLQESFIDVVSDSGPLFIEPVKHDKKFSTGNKKKKKKKKY